MSQQEIKTIPAVEWNHIVQRRRTIPEVFVEIGRDEVIVENENGQRWHKVAVRNDSGIITGYFSCEL